ncbi:AAA family ATPase [Bacillus altitudinis]|uniref:AAA family ATPase n=1 Tax=Bacillus altitudinis TaxID=293387 RepID=UPI00240A5B67|nr:AAA family ATPase [Bacillus altitudinis]WEZ70311.1 AAA family ATPase [Bacillus altitudinis]
MELIYVWVDKYRNINNMGFNLSPRFNVDFNKQLDATSSILTIQEINKNPKLFEQKIDNITGIIGKNGSGKTNILDLVGAKRYDRSSLSNNKKIKYFFIYHLESNKFAIEGSDFDYIKDYVEEYSISGNRNHISEPYSIIVEKQENKLFYKGFLQDDQEIDYKDNINFFSFRHNDTSNVNRHHRSMIIENEPSHLFNRINLNKKNTGYSAIYQMIIDLQKEVDNTEERNFMFNFRNNIYLTISPHMHVNDDVKLELEKGFENDFFNMTNETGIKFNEKQDFINLFLYKLCHSLVSQFFILPKMETKLLNIISNIKNFQVEEDDYYSYYKKIIALILKYNEYGMQIIETIESYIKCISEFDPVWFNRDNIIIPLNNVKYNESINKFLELFDSLNFMSEQIQSVIKVFLSDFHPFSAGEEALLSLFSALHYGLSLDYNTNKDKAIILLDEPDSFMHPEWSRLLINELTSFLNRLENGYRNYHLIITTHSPFIISDLPKENIIALEKDISTGLCQQISIEDSFASNIHTLLARDFFMTSTIGEFAKYKINKTISLLNKGHLTPNEKEETDYIISIIGEPLIKNKLKVMSEKAFDKEKTIQKLKARIMELENDDINNKQ